MKLKQASKELLETHYEDLKAKPFFPGLVTYMASGPVCPMVRQRSSDSAHRALARALQLPSPSQFEESAAKAFSPVNFRL